MKKTCATSSHSADRARFITTSLVLRTCVSLFFLIATSPVMFAAPATNLAFACPSNMVTTATGPGGAVVFYSVSASGGCSPPPFVSASPPSGSTFPIGTTTVLATASDTCGSSTNCSFTVTVNPQSMPISITCPSNIVMTATGPGGAVVFYTVSASGGCSPPPFVSASPPSGSTFPIGTTTVLATASDTCGSSTNCSFTVTVNPQSTPISITCPSNIVMTATGPGGAVVFYTVSASGGCGPPPFVSASPPSGSTFPIGTTTVLAMASDACGSTTNCSFTVTVNPQSMPISITCPSNIVMTATGPGGAVVFYTASASGGCSPPPFVGANPPSGSTFPIGTTTVFATASDTCGSSTNCSFTVTVNPVSSSVDLSLVESGPTIAAVGQAVTFQISLHNNGPDLALQIVVEEYPPAGLTFIGSSAPPGTTYDSSIGRWSVPVLTNGETQMLFLSAVANAPATITNRNAIIASSPTDSNPTNDIASATVVFQDQFLITATAGANGGITPSGSIGKNAGQSQSFTALPDPDFGVDGWFVDGNLIQPGGPGFILSNILANHSMHVTFRTGPLPPFITQPPQSQAVQSCTPAAFVVTAVGTEPFSYRWFFEEQPITGATNASLSLASVKPDEAGNYSVIVSGAGGSVTSVVAALTVLNDAPPVIACPTDLAVPCSTPGGAQVFFSATAVDDCDSNVSVTCVPPAGSFFPLGETTVVCTARDSAQNSSICRFTVRVFDQNPPALTATLQGNQMLITWPPGCGNYILQQTVGLNPPAWTPLLVPVITNGGFNMVVLPLTNAMQFFSLGNGFQLQFVTSGPNGEIVPQSFTYNSAPCPQIAATIDTFTPSQTGQVTLTVSGTVVDTASDLVDSPAAQVQELRIFLDNQLLTTLPLTNQATPELPWKPYRFEAPFSATLTLPTPGLGTFSLQLITASNVAGCSGLLMFDLNVDDEGADIAMNAANDAGTFLPTMIRVDAPESAFLGTGSQIRAFDNYWTMQRQNWGDGYFWYAVDGLGKPVVYLPAAYAHSYTQTKKIEIEFKAEIIKGAAVEGKGKIPVENGLLVTTDDVEALLAPLKNYEKKGYQQVRGPTVFIYRPAANYDRKDRTDKSVKTEILWRYVGTEETMMVFIGGPELDRDLLYRQKIVEATEQVKFPFGGAARVNNEWWTRLFQVKAGKSASDALADIFNNRASDTLYRMACYPAAHSIQQRAASQALTPATFDGVMYGRDTFKNAWRVKAQLVQPNEARWIPGDWGYLQNTDPNGTNRAGTGWGLVSGENVIYVGGSFDTNLDEFKKNAVFWGHFDPARPTRKLKDWLAAVDRFTGTQAEVDAGNHWGKIGKNRYLLRQPAEAGSLLLVDGAELMAHAFAGGSAKVAGNDYAIVGNNAQVVRTATAVSFPFTIKKGQNQKNGTLCLFSTADGKSRINVTGISMSSNEFKDGKLTVQGTDYDITGNTALEISTATAVTVPVELKKGNTTEMRNITKLFIP